MEKQYLVFHLVIAFAAAYFAYRKGRSLGLWLAYAFAAGPLALIHAMLISPSDEVIVRRGEEEGRVRCPKCFERIQPHATVCPFCHSNLLRTAGG